MKDMMRRHLGFLLITVVAVLFAVVTEAASSEMFGISIRSLPVMGKEKVAGFELNIRAGRVVALPSIPMGWYIAIDNDPSWNTRIKGSLIVGAAALAPDFFTDFVIVEKNEYMDLKFEVKVEIVVTEDFQNERRIRLGIKDLVLTRK